MKIIIFGATEVGCLLATEFFEDHDITIIDKEENRTDEFNKLDISFVQGNASDIEVLKKADIRNADVFIACTAIDEANIVACLAAKKMSGVRTICFVGKEEYKNALMFCGRNSGRDCDKAKETGLTPMEIDGSMSFEESEMVVVCKKLFSQDIDPAGFIDKSLDNKNYPDKDYHKM